MARKCPLSEHNRRSRPKSVKFQRRFPWLSKDDKRRDQQKNNHFFGPLRMAIYVGAILWCWGVKRDCLGSRRVVFCLSIPKRHWSTSHARLLPACGWSVRESVRWGQWESRLFEWAKKKVRQTRTLGRLPNLKTLWNRLFGSTWTKWAS